MRLICFLVFLALAVLSCSGAEESWTGNISDSKCGARHKATSTHSAAKLSDADCTVACVKNGAKYVFAINGKVYKIENQDFADLPKYAGQAVRLTGEMSGGSIKVSKIAVAIRGEKSTL